MISPNALPDVRAFLEKMSALPGPNIHEMEPHELRVMRKDWHHEIETEIGPLGTLRDETIARDDGSAMKIRIFDSRESRGEGPVVVFFHGGGWVLCSIESHGALCAEISRQIDLPVISVDYRLAPEHPWPAAPDDAELAARSIAEWPDVTGLILAGDSAGGNLAIVTSLALRDRLAEVPVIAQWPIYPVVHPGTRTRSFEAYGEGHGMTRDQVAWYYKLYRAERRHWRAWPAYASPAGLPPTLVTTAELDVLADQGRAYAEACTQAGVRTIFREAPGRVHGYMTSRKAMPSGQEELTKSVELLKQLLS